MELTNVTTDNIYSDWLSNKNIRLSVLRLDKIDPVISGNKWFKLKYYLQDARMQQKSTVATFGGAWSNHIVATAYGCKEAGLKSIGVIRGEQPEVLSSTLQDALKYGMELVFVTRNEYKSKDAIINTFKNKDWYWVNEGGFGATGARGAAEIVSLVDNFSSYSYIIGAVGTGTMLAGLILSANDQKVIGISSMKGNYSLDEDIKKLVNTQKPNASFKIIHDYHFGGYGKHPLELMEFINDIYLAHNLPLDIVYTGKTLYAIKELAKKDYFQPGSNLLMIHSGGLQGNHSLAKEVLVF